MKEIIKIVEQLRNTSSTNDKIAILKANKDNELLQKVLEYTYNPYKKYKITEKTQAKTPMNDTFTTRYENIFSLLDKLSSSNINDNLRRNVSGFLSHENEDIRQLYSCILLKDLRCNISATTINKVWKGLIPTFDVMLAKSYRDFSHKVVGDFIITTKLDGSRLVAWREGDVCKFYTRQGKEVEGLVELEHELLSLPDRMVFDGELIAENPNNLSSKDLFQLTRKMASKKGNKTGLEYHVFDMLPLEEFQKGKSKLGCYERKIKLGNHINNTLGMYMFKFVPILYYGNDIKMINELHTQAKENNLEGIMINLADAPYVCKRTDTLLKVKEFYTLDLKVVDIQEGTGKYEGKLGALLVEYKGNIVGVGSGYTDLDREHLYNKNIIGRVIEVQCFEETVDEKTGLPSLRFPVFCGLRDVGKEVSYN